MKIFSAYVGLLMLILSPVVVAKEWAYSIDRDEFNDQTVHLARASSLDGRGFAVARCNSDLHFDIIFSVGEFIGSRDSYRVRWRMDSSEPESSDWSVSTEGTSVFVSNTDKVALAQRLLTSNELLLEVTDFRGTPHQKRFSLSGSASTVGQVMEACNVSTERVLIDGVEESVIQRVSMWGARNTQCNKRMLSSLGYQIADSTSDKTDDVYLALQAYMDDKYRACTDGSATFAEKSFHCKQKNRFLSQLYADAVSRNSSFREECGSLYIGD